MGKPYGKELENLTRTYQWALEAPIEKICSFVGSSKNQPLITVGSGGSFTVASLITLLHQDSGMISKTVTPLNLISLGSSIKNSSVLFLSAGGSNFDILSAFQLVASLEPTQIMGICLRSQSPLARLAEKFYYTDVIEYEPPVKKDGFLATNSILALIVLFIRAYKEVNSDSEVMPKELISINSISAHLNNIAQPLLKKDTWIVLYGGWGLPAALDAESKFIESAMKNLQISDYRNFAHGRHYWLCKRADNTGIIALITPDEKEIAEKTLSLIPKDIPVIRLNTERLGSLGSIDLIIQILFLVHIVGISEGIDPGMPKVPNFGREIYHLHFPRKIIHNKKPRGITTQEIHAISLKSNFNQSNEMKNDEFVFWKNSLKDFTSNIESTTFGAIVFDYDGTLCDPRERYANLETSISKELIRLLGSGIFIGIATGRGKSVRENLRTVIPDKYWEKVLIGYYNGSDIAFLNDDEHPNKSKPIDSTLISVKYLLENDQCLRNLVKVEYRPMQISIEPSKPQFANVAKSILLELTNKSKLTGVQILESSHSIDILAPGVTKLTIVNECKKLAKKAGSPEEVLCIGDKGRWPGNDYELLSTSYSLSVDSVSSDPKSCWNLGIEGQRGMQTTLYYMKNLKVFDGFVRLKFERIKEKKDEEA